MYAWRNATNSSSRLRAITPRTLAGVTNRCRLPLRHQDEAEDHRQDDVPGEHVGEEPDGQDEVADEQARRSRSPATGARGTA